MTETLTQPPEAQSTLHDQAVAAQDHVHAAIEYADTTNALERGKGGDRGTGTDRTLSGHLMTATDVRVSPATTVHKYEVNDGHFDPGGPSSAARRTSVSVRNNGSNYGAMIDLTNTGGAADAVVDRQGYGRHEFKGKDKGRAAILITKLAGKRIFKEAAEINDQRAAVANEARAKYDERTSK